MPPSSADFGNSSPVICYSYYWNFIYKDTHSAHGSAVALLFVKQFAGLLDRQITIGVRVKMRKEIPFDK